MGTSESLEKVVLSVNGREREARAGASTTLLALLREDFGLAATRFGCGTERCGACVVLMDGNPI